MANSIADSALPPQNLEAEELILGGVLLDPEAITRIVHLLVPEVFYLKAHQEIYRAVLHLYQQQKPTDLMTVTSWLADHDLLEKVGGNLKLAQLVDRTVSAVNIDIYADLVLEKALRRQLITAGHEIVSLGYDTTKSLDLVCDESQQKIFNITQKNIQQGLVPLYETIGKTFSEIENLNQNIALPGITCGFYDLDAMTSGFGRSDLIIIAGRPSMGKTSFALNIALNIAKDHQLPVAIFSLEMSREQLAIRLLASEAGIDSNRLRAGRVSQQEMDPLALAVGSLSDTPLFINDSATLTVMQMRSEVRRLQAEQKNPLGMILIDYLQLMEGGGDNRVQEISKITRSLKALAREVNTPVIALSQLSRGVEARNNKRPMMADLRESGSIEQDADLIIMLYRDEYYNPDTPDRGIAEAIVTKHRNGPTGPVKLLFKAELTKFLNLQKAQDY